MNASSTMVSSVKLRLGYAGPIWSIVNQALASCFTLTLSILLARSLSANQFGSFVLLSAGLYFLTTLQSALVTQPHNVIGASLPAADYRTFTSSLLWLQAGIAMVTALLTIFGSQVLRLDPVFVGTLPTLGLASVPWQMHEFFRRILFTEQRERTASFVDFSSYTATLTILLLLDSIDRLSLPNIFLCIACGFSLGTIAGFFAVFRSVRQNVSYGDVRSSIGRAWDFGKWIVGSTIAFWASSQMFPFLAAATVGVAAAGGLRAAQQLMGPATLLIRGLESALLPRVSHTCSHEGTLAARALTLQWTKSFAVPVLAYSLMIGLLASPITEWVYGPQYSSNSWLIRVFAFGQVTLLVAIGASVLLRGLKAPQMVFQGQAIAAAVSILCGIPLAYLFGMRGIGIALVLESIALAAAMTLMANTRTKLEM